jgi:ribosomal-protein-alanine N-acetyltransferase
MRLDTGRAILRPFVDADAPALAHHANDEAVWAQLRDRFPHPYTLTEARAFLAFLAARTEPVAWCVEVDGEAAGAVGLEPLADIEYVSAELGYWLGRAHWGRGVMGGVVRAFVPWAFATQPEIERIFALPFADNTASRRVLEGAGFVVEGRLHHSARKAGRLRDQVLYATYRD